MIAGAGGRDAANCKTGCEYWSEVLGECTLPARERTCGSRELEVRAVRRRTGFNLFRRAGDLAAAEAADLARCVATYYGSQRS